jgi:rRNA maturation protein Nop10
MTTSEYDEQLAYTLTVRCPHCQRPEGEICRHADGTDKVHSHRERWRLADRYRELRAAQTRTA